MKTLWKTTKLVEIFQTKNFEIIVQYKQTQLPFWDIKTKWAIEFEFRKKWTDNSQYRLWFWETFNSLDESRDFFDKFLEDNFILYAFDENGD